jgi:transposase
MAPAYARAPRGQRAYSDVPFNPGRNLTLTVGLRVTGWLAPLILPGATNGDVFTTYVKTQLAPQVRRGDIVLVDDLGAHRVVTARVVLRACGARLVLLPPYSPDFSPVEALGSKLKGIVRQRKPRTEEAVIDALGGAFGSITRSDARSWFGHYGYRRQRKRSPL